MSFLALALLSLLAILHLNYSRAKPFCMLFALPVKVWGLVQ